ncbi:MAG: GNAT family N-acetyltransferase [Alphaproteobacteria bacterium]|nr:GNAT family N-acetyltransferase [Alphaproteobacteria bacterium]
MVEIRPFRAEDLAGARACLDRVARERSGLALVEAPPLEECRAFHAALIADGLPCLLALDGGEVCGWCDIQRDGRAGCRHVGMLGIGVAASHRGRGIGRRLLEAAIAQARGRGIERIELQVVAGNMPAIRLYRRLGFREEGRRVAARRLDGRTEDMILMALLDQAEDERK